MNNFQTARRLKEKRYVGKQCAKNSEHGNIRYTCNSACVECEKIRNNYAENREYQLNYKKAYNKMLYN